MLSTCSIGSMHAASQIRMHACNYKPANILHVCMHAIIEYNYSTLLLCSVLIAHPAVHPALSK